MTNIRKIAPFAAMAMGVVLAFAASAFKQVPHSKSGDDMYTFQYDPEGTYTESSVQDTSSWQYTSSPVTCLGSDKACTIQVSEDYVNVPATPSGTPTLKGSINIQAQLNSNGHAFVAGTADNDAIIANQPD
ncbi:hypothetical protein A9P82_10645 [Arachidicoccus ginsenosidimutans]|uniref:hypothetical protein n=1 Tax=Arachidicoccus sp. BS20 TaxID=1850526 RepID=UPI0007F0972D|nr:hypothetical protein [Arachidicoccus sp. BS20]ANI89706.1 hypothetical protein A9P82_10645 [Arachidicoccus sp. BS20]